jgi:hypothetical protein
LKAGVCACGSRFAPALVTHLVVVLLPMIYMVSAGNEWQSKYKVSVNKTFGFSASAADKKFDLYINTALRQTYTSTVRL